MHYFSALFGKELHVSNRFTVRHRESYYCIHTNRYFLC